MTTKSGNWRALWIAGLVALVVSALGKRKRPMSTRKARHLFLSPPSNQRLQLARLLVLVLAAVSLVTLAVIPASAQQVLRTIDLGTLPGGTLAIAQAVSPNGTIAGRAIGGDGAWHAFLWTESRGMIDLAAFPGAFDVQVNGVNDSGLVVGMVLDGSGVRHVFMATETGGIVVDPKECVGFCDRVAVNASGQVVGSHLSTPTTCGPLPDGSFGCTSGKRQAFLWSQASGFTDLPIPANALGASANAINDAGQIAGAINLGFSPNILNAIRWTPTSTGYDFLDLGRISDQSYGTGINAGGDVIGTYGDSSGNFGRGFLWTAASGLVDLSASIPNVINVGPGGITNGGLIAGSVSNSDGGQAFMYKAGIGFRRLPNPAGIVGAGARAVDSFGLATGFGFTSTGLHAVAWQSCQSRDVHPSTPGFGQSGIQAANDSSFAVGWVAADDFSVFHAFAWEFVHPGPPPPTPCEFDAPAVTNQAPVAQCANRIVNTAPGTCSATASVDNGSSDPDGDPITLAQSPAGPYATGDTRVTLTVSDGRAEAQCEATVTVADNENPTITCPAPSVVRTSSLGGSCAASLDISPVASDNCGVSVTSCSASQLSLAAPGSASASCSVTDSSGNSTSCGTSLTLIDDTPPTVSCVRVPKHKGRGKGHRHHDDDDDHGGNRLFRVTASDGCGQVTITLGGVQLANGEVIRIDSKKKPGVILVAHEHDDDDDNGRPRPRRFRVGPGQAVITATDAAGNEATAICPIRTKHGDDDDDDR